MNVVASLLLFGVGLILAVLCFSALVYSTPPGERANNWILVLFGSIGVVCLTLSSVI